MIKHLNILNFNPFLTNLEVTPYRESSDHLGQVQVSVS